MPAERAVETYKACFKSVIYTLPKEFPMGLWCRLLLQIELGVNIVKACRMNPLLSAWAVMNGEYHFHAMPMAPPGPKMMINQAPGNRRTYGPNAETTWYTGPCLQHYRTFTGIVPKTGGKKKI